MSALIYPTLPGLSIEVQRGYEWKTLVAESLSGKQAAVGERVYPLVHFELTYNVLRDVGAPAFSGSSEIQTIMGLFNQMQGRTDTFLFTDPDFNTVSRMFFATGDGATTSFQLLANYGGTGQNVGSDIIQNLNGPLTIYLNRFGDYELLSTGLRENYNLQSTFAASWSITGTGATLTANTVVAPDGTTTAAKYTLGTSGTVYSIQQAQTGMPVGSQWTFSCFLKYAGHRYFNVILDADGPSTDAISVCFDLVGGAAAAPLVGSNGSNAAAGITGVNGWYRCWVSVLLPSSDTVIRTGIVAASSFTSAFYAAVTGDGQPVDLWGAQLELGVVGPTAYIATTTTAVTNGGSDYSVGPTCLVTLTTVLANGAALAWSGSFYYRCRFDEDAMVPKRFMNKLWSLQVKFTSVKL